jgi:hypothetical protein
MTRHSTQAQAQSAKSRQAGTPVALHCRDGAPSLADKMRIGAGNVCMGAGRGVPRGGPGIALHDGRLDEHEEGNHGRDGKGHQRQLPAVGAVAQYPRGRESQIPRQGRGTVNMNKSSDPFAAACASSRYPARPTNRLANAVTPEDKEEDEAHQALDESMHHLAHLHRHCVLPHS